MKQILEYRTNLIDRLEGAANEFNKACLAVGDPFKALEQNGWNTHQVAAHTLIYTLITAANKNKMFYFKQFTRHLLGKKPSLW